jgi:hypothetical protein
VKRERGEEKRGYDESIQAPLHELNEVASVTYKLYIHPYNKVRKMFEVW